VHRSTISPLLIAAALLLAPGKSPADSANDLAVIVNKQTPVLVLTSRDLRSILLGQMDHWPSGQKIVAATLSTELPETRFVLKQVCAMSEGDFKRYFMQLAFQGKTVSLPKIMRNSAAIKALVSATPGALGIIPAREVDGLVNVVTLDGSNPGASNYKLAMNQ
jgi:hypothetical protein